MPPTSIYAFPEHADIRLRRKYGTPADPNFVGLQRDLDLIEVQISGTAAAGVYSIQAAPLDSAVATPAAVSFTRAAENNAAIIAALDSAFDTPITGGVQGVADGALFRYYSAVTSSGTSLFLRVKPDAPPHRLTLTTPDVGSILTALPDDVYPIARTSSNIRGDHSLARNALAVAFVSLDSSSEPNDDNNTCTLDVELVRVVERRYPWDTPNTPERTRGVTSSEAVTTHPIRDELRVPNDGGRYTIQINGITNAPTDHASLEVWIREVNE